MIYIICGDIGSGKTLHCLEWMKQAASVGRPVYTNIELLPKCPFHDQVALMDDGEWPVIRGNGPGDPTYKAWWHYAVPGSLIVVDEADIYMDCTDHGALGKDVRGIHKLVRKMDWDIVYIVQNIRNFYVRIRRLASRFILCEWNYRTQRLFRYLPIHMSRFLRSEYGDEEFWLHRGDGYISYGEASRMFGWYRTKQLLGDLSLYRNQWIGRGDDDGDAQSGNVPEAAGGGGDSGGRSAGVAAVSLA